MMLISAARQAGCSKSVIWQQASVYPPPEDEHSPMMPTWYDEVHCACPSTKHTHTHTQPDKLTVADKVATSLHICPTLSLSLSLSNARLPA